VTPTRATAVLDREQLRNVTLDDDELMRDILDALIDDTSRQMKLLEIAIAAGDQQSCARLCHYSKGACANVGATTAADILRDMEFTARHADFEKCRASLTALAGEVEKLRVEAGSL
jgi:HPt (histidine-containing phosphotransfer) domain-containing protein